MGYAEVWPVHELDEGQRARERGSQRRLGLQRWAGASSFRVCLKPQPTGTLGFISNATGSFGRLASGIVMPSDLYFGKLLWLIYVHQIGSGQDPK